MTATTRVPVPRVAPVADSSATRQVTRQELLDTRERHWPPLLRGVSLVAEAEIREGHRTEASLAAGPRSDDATAILDVDVTDLDVENW